MFSDKIDFRQLTKDALEEEIDSDSYDVIEVKTESLGVKCHSGMPRPPRVGGITTPKEFFLIMDAIAFSKLHNLLVTDELVWALSGIKKTKNAENNQRVKTLISSIIELSQVYDDLYTDNRRIMEEDDDGKYVLYPDASIDRDEASISIVENLEQLETEQDINKMIQLMESIGYSDHEKYHFIPTLLSPSFVSDITKDKFRHQNPLFLYHIEAYLIAENDYGTDIRHDAMMRRWYDHVLENGLDEDRVFDLKNFKTKIGTLFGYAALKYFPKYKRNLQSTKAVSTHGEHLFKLYLATATNKNGFVGSRNTSLRFFTEGTTLVNFHIDFFEKDKIYMKNWHYLVYSPKEEMDMVAEEVFDFIKTLTFKEPEDENIQETNDIFSFDFDELMGVNIRDRINIFAHAIGVKDGRVWVDIDSDDNGFSRVYSLMTTIKSESRLGLVEYDVGTSQQTIMMNVVNDWDSYPLHARLVHDKVAFRTEIGQMLNCSYEEAKEHITAISNGRSLDFYKKVFQKNKLKPFYEEAGYLVQEFMSIAERRYRDIYIRAETLAKEASDDEKQSRSGKRFYGHVFHVYTYFERQIREAMKSCFAEPVYDVHDAVYSREKIDPALLEGAVLEEAGFSVHIESSATL